MPDLLNIPTFLLAIVTLLFTIGGLLAVRQGASKRAAEVEERVIKALNAEIATQDRKIKALEKDRDRQDRIFDAIRYILKQRGWKVTIDGEVVTLEDNAGKSNVIRIQDKLSMKQTTDDDATDAI